MNHIKTSITIALSFLLIASSASVALAQSDKGKATSEQHRSKVAETVKALTVVAQEQESSNERATKAIEVVEARGGFKTFLIGTDYKNIGALRSEVVTTQNSINRLTKAKERATDDSVKADLDAQIKALEETNMSALNFIKTNESKFSIFGWLVKLFQ
jgi:hypothetical protein